MTENIIPKTHSDMVTAWVNYFQDYAAGTRKIVLVKDGVEYTCWGWVTGNAQEITHIFEMDTTGTRPIFLVNNGIRTQKAIEVTSADVIKEIIL